ncbi:uncharacterized protein si:ch211-153b23.4 [Rhincodon typus]|uniref:uncharacterized protein si:ch211-153b23.4 n=1 Tax=Rhincodon typus TaxID=259920 RepID=UPI002030D2E7|nr:uncharacterized protein si:ch211-153b23.4 [Rhincodon typus]
MSRLQETTETLHYSVGILSTCAGALLLTVDRYSTVPLIPSTALGILLLIVAALVGYTGRVCEFLSKGKIIFPGTCLHKSNSYLKSETIKNDVVVVGYITNMLSASVLGCQVLGVTTKLFVGQVPWLWTAAVYQIVVCVLSYRANDSLIATFFGFTSILKFAEGYAFLFKLWQDDQPFFPVPAPIVLAVLFFILALFMTGKSLVDGIYLLFFVSYCISVASNSTGFFHGGAQGVSVAIFVASACLVFISLFNSIGFITIPTGKGIIKGFLIRMNTLTPKSDKDTQNPYLGYSKYSDAEILAHACNVVAAFAITASVNTSAPLATVVLPWIIIPGGVLQLLCGSISFSRGKTLESCAFILYGLIWIIWGLTRYGGLYGSTRGFGIAVGIICFLLFNGFVVIGTFFLNAAWFAFTLSFQLILISFLLDAVNSNPFGYDIGVTIIFGLVSFYCFLATLFNQSFERPQLPLGHAWASLCGFGQSNSICPHLSSRKTSSVRKIAEIMRNGGTCGIPTDTVYVLVAACNCPDAVEKAYNTKKQAKERPMSLWISNVTQLEPAKHLLSPLLWDLMQKVWPSSISLVIPRGEWLNLFGLQHAEKYIGTPQSIAIRIPDCTVTTHLIDQVGPIAVTSANPTGEADTTHHNQVYAKLGNKVDAVLCDGPSPENIASTVVDCTKIETGTLGFFRVGLVPKSQVLQLFEEVKKKHLKGQINDSFNQDETERNTFQHSEVTTAYDNAVFINDENENKL